MDIPSIPLRSRVPGRATVALVATVGAVLVLGALAWDRQAPDRAADGTTVPGVTVAGPAPVTVALDGGVEVDVHLPGAGTEHPVLVFVHGGGWTDGDRTDLPADLGVQDLVSRGWAVVSTDYRHAHPSTGVTAADQTQDVALALDWVRGAGRTLGLGEHVVAMGHSAGAHLVALAASTVPATNRPDEVLLVSGVYDFSGDVVANPLLGPAAEAALGCTSNPCDRRSPMEPATFADAGDPPVTIVHGTRDRIVNPSTAERYGRALERAGVTVEVRMVHGGHHLDGRLGGVVRSILDTWTERSRNG